MHRPLTKFGWSTILGDMEVTVQEAKTHLSRLLRQMEAGEQIIIMRGRQRVAALVPAPPEGPTREIWGDLRGRIHDDFDVVPEDFAEYVE